VWEHPKCPGWSPWSPQRQRSRRPFFLSAAWFDCRNSGEIGREVVGVERLDTHLDQAHKRAAKIRFGCTASIDNHAYSGDCSAVGVDDIDCLLYASTASDNIFHHDEPFICQNLKTSAQHKFAFFFFGENMAFA